jgi:hypothetical protein
MQMPITGGCACGAIRYEAAVEPVMMFNCHCRDCQHATGGACANAVIFPAEAFRFVRGTPRYHDSEASSGGQHRRGYCADCGSRLTGGQNPGGRQRHRRRHRWQPGRPRPVPAADGHLRRAGAALGTDGP